MPGAAELQTNEKNSSEKRWLFFPLQEGMLLKDFVAVLREKQLVIQ